MAKGYDHSIMTDDLDTCYICGRDRTQFHHVFGASNRNHSTEDGLFIPVCAECHESIHKFNTIAITLKQEGQRRYEETYSREEFMKRYGKNYI